MDHPDLAAQLRAVLPTDCVLSQEEELRPYECDGLPVFRQRPAVVVLPRDRAAGAPGAPHLQPPQGPRGGARLWHWPVRRRDTACAGRTALVRADESHPRHRSCGSHRAAGARSPEPARVGGRGGAWALLRPGSVLAGRLLHRRECRGELRWRALPEIRTHRAQRAGGSRLHHGRGARWNWAAAPPTVRAWTSWRSRSARRAS